MYCHVCNLVWIFLYGTCMAIYGTVVCYNMAPKWPLAALRVTRLWPKDHQRHELHQWIVAFRALGNLISTREIISIIPGQWGASRNFHNVIEIIKVIGYILKLEDQVSLGKGESCDPPARPRLNGYWRESIRWQICRQSIILNHRFELDNRRFGSDNWGRWAPCLQSASTWRDYLRKGMLTVQLPTVRVAKSTELYRKTPPPWLSEDAPLYGVHHL